MKSLSLSPVSLILIIVAVCSLVSMIGLLQVDRIVNQDMYAYGLHFSYAWAMPYWTLSKIMFAMGWFNIIAAIAFHVYILAFGVNDTEKFETEVEKEISKIEMTEKTQGIQEEKAETSTEPEMTPEMTSEQSVEELQEQESKPTEPVEQREQTPQMIQKEEESPQVVAETSQAQAAPTQHEPAGFEPSEQKKEISTEAVEPQPKETETKLAEPEETKQETPSPSE